MKPLREFLKRLFAPAGRLPAPESDPSASQFVTVGGVTMTMAELDDWVRYRAESLKRQRLAGPISRDILKLIGYWAPPEWRERSEWEMRFLVAEPPWPDVRRAVRPGWRAADRVPLVNYLQNGHFCRGALGSSSCRFRCRGNYWILGSAEQTDGEWIWPEGLPHYVERHGVTLPDEFVASAAARGWKVPPIPSGVGGEPVTGRDAFAGREIDPSAWLEWAARLPPVTAPPAPDPDAVGRGCLIIQRDHAAPPDEYMDAFDELVWDKLDPEYGRSAPGVGDEWFIERVLVTDRDIVLAAALDGLRRYGLTNRTNLIWAAPDPADWQRDRDTVVSAAADGVGGGSPVG